MVSSRAVTVEQYLAELPPGRREVIATVRDVINAHVPPGYVEAMNWGMICWEIPLSRFPDTYNGHPLAYVALAAQKNNFALYGMTAYMSPEVTARLREEFRRAGAKLDMGQSCIRFKTLDGLPVGAIELLASFATVEQYLEYYERGRHGRTKPARKPATRRTARVAPAARQAAKRPAARASTPKRTKPAAKRAAKKRR